MYEGVMHMVNDIYRTPVRPHLEQYRKRDCLLAIRTAIEAQYLVLTLKS